MLDRFNEPSKGEFVFPSFYLFMSYFFYVIYILYIFLVSDTVALVTYWYNTTVVAANGYQCFRCFRCFGQKYLVSLLYISLVGHWILFITS